MTRQSSIPHADGAAADLPDLRVPVLITRPEPGASRIADALDMALPGRLRLVLAPLMRPEFSEIRVPDAAFAALVLTSETGARAAGRLRRAGASLPPVAFCVGDRTAEEARAEGFIAHSAAGEAGALARMILATPDEGPLLYLHGEDRAADLGAVLAPHGRRVTSLPVYAQRALPLTREASDLLQTAAPILLPLFSPRSARLLLAALPEGVQADLLPVAISANTQAELPGWLAARCRIAAHPDMAAMMEAILGSIPPHPP